MKTRAANKEWVLVWFVPAEGHGYKDGYRATFWLAEVLDKKDPRKWKVKYKDGMVLKESVEFITKYPMPPCFADWDIETGEWVLVDANIENDVAYYTGIVQEVVIKGKRKEYTICYPWHKDDTENVAAEHVRRACLWVGDDWKFVKKGQNKEDACKVDSPMKLSLVSEEVYIKQLRKKGGRRSSENAGDNRSSDQAGDASGSRGKKQRSGSAAGADQDASGSRGEKKDSGSRGEQQRSGSDGEKQRSGSAAGADQDASSGSDGGEDQDAKKKKDSKRTLAASAAAATTNKSPKKSKPAKGSDA